MRGCNETSWDGSSYYLSTVRVLLGTLRRIDVLRQRSVDLLTVPLGRRRNHRREVERLRWEHLERVTEGRMWH
jgi:hypothetical protein